MAGKTARRRLISLGWFMTLVLTFALSGCSGSDSSSPPPQAATEMWGEVELGGLPLVGATLTVFDTSGVVLQTEENATGPFGAFWFNVGHAPTDFNIMVTGGTLDGEPFTGQVQALIRGFTDDTWLSINEITTIVAAYAEANPELSYGEVTDIVSIFLGIPYYASLQEVIDSCDVYGGIFSPVLFMQGVKDTFTTFDLNDYIDLLVTEIDEGDQHLFAEQDDYEAFFPPGVDPWDDAEMVTPMGAAAVIGKVIEVVGGLIDMAGSIADIVFTVLYQNAVGEALTTIISQLNAVQGQLIDIQTQLAKMEFLQVQGDYDTRMQTLNPYLTTIKTHITELQNWAKIIPTEPDKIKVKKDRIREIQDAILSAQTGGGYANLLLNLSNGVASNDATTPLMKLRSQVMQKRLGPYDTATMDGLYLPFFQELVFRQLQGWVLYTHAYRDRFGDNPTARNAYNSWRNTNLKWQVDSCVQGAEDYALSHKNGAFFDQEFPCNDASGSFLSTVDMFAEAVYPTFPKKDNEGNVVGVQDGVFFVRLAFPVFPPPSDGNYLDANNYLVKLNQNQDPAWMKSPNQSFVNKHNGDIHFLHQLVNYYTLREISEGWIAFSSSTPNVVSFYEPVKWVLGTFRIPASLLMGYDYNFYATSPCLKKCAPHLYRGGDSEAKLQVSKDLKHKYGWWHLQMAPSLETAIDTWYKRPDRISHIWVDSGETSNLKVYTALETNQFGSRTDNLMIKYVGNGYFTVSPNSGQSSPYHLFCVDPQYLYPPDFPRKGFEVRARSDAFCLWEIMKHRNAPDDDITKVIRLHATGYYDKLTEYNGWWIQGSAAAPGETCSLYYHFLQNWGVWSGDHRSLLFPVKHGSEWLFD